MRRYLVPGSILAVAIVTTVLTVRANNAADVTNADADPTTTPRVATPLLSATRIPEWLLQPETDSALAAALANVLPPAGEGGVERACLTVHRDGVMVTSQNPLTTVVPGELQRLLTAAAAFESLPPDNQFTTNVVIDPGVEIVEGSLQGNIWLVGRGDPTLSTSSYLDRFGDDRARTDFTLLADRVAAALTARGITTIAGSVLADESRYPVQRDYRAEEAIAGGAVWDADDLATNSVGPLSALLLDDGFDSWPAEIDSPLNQRSPDPAATAAGSLGDLLAERGIVVEGLPRNEDAPDDREELTNIGSPPLAPIIARSMIDGTTAEMVVKALGDRSGGDGFRADSLFRGVFAALVRLAIPLMFEGDGIAIEDGSGLSDRNSITCPALAAILDHPDVGPSVVAAMPPVAATSLAGCAPQGGEELRLLASAEENHTSLAGVFTAGNGDDITFVMMASGPDLGASLGPCNGLQTTLLDTVAGHPYGPDLSSYLPGQAVTE